MVQKISKSQISIKTLEEVGVSKWPLLSWSGAPAAIIIDDSEKPEAYKAVWGLPEKVSTAEAWSDFDHADEYEIVN